MKSTPSWISICGWPISCWRRRILKRENHRQKDQKKENRIYGLGSAKRPELLAHFAHFFDGEEFVRQPGEQLRQLREQLQVHMVEGLWPIGEHFQNARARILVKDRENHYRAHPERAARCRVHPRASLGVIGSHGHAGALTLAGKAG